MKEVPEVFSTFEDQVKGGLKRSNMTQEDLAIIMGVSRTNLNRKIKKEDFSKSERFYLEKEIIESKKCRVFNIISSNPAFENKKIRLVKQYDGSFIDSYSKREFIDAEDEFCEIPIPGNEYINVTTFCVFNENIEPLQSIKII